MKENLAELWPDILCLYPVQDEWGTNSTVILLRQGRSMTLPRRTKTVLKELAGVFAVDVEALKKRCGPVLGRKTSTPLPLRPDFILLPVKMRVPEFKDAGAWGYLVQQMVVSCQDLGKGQSQINFSDGSSVLSCQRAASIKILLAQGQMLRSQLKELFYYPEVERESFCRESCSLLRTIILGNVSK